MSKTRRMDLAARDAAQAIWDQPRKPTAQWYVEAMKRYSVASVVRAESYLTGQTLKECARNVFDVVCGSDTLVERHLSRMISRMSARGAVSDSPRPA